ncbi:DUF2635 domain-containing protein [Vibrio sp. TRT 21S02]|uniref:DUF2635 domain-containing protein n=1 Tax=Vibrio sp. TRT 21S02 TaxID=3418507 RepID=UPI003CFA7DB7
MTAQLILVKPAKPGVKVRKEDGKHLNEKGEKVKRTGFWIRRIKQGDVIDVEAQRKASMKKAREAKAAKAKAKKTPAAEPVTEQHDNSDVKGE